MTDRRDTKDDSDSLAKARGHRHRPVIAILLNGDATLARDLICVVARGGLSEDGSLATTAGRVTLRTNADGPEACLHDTDVNVWGLMAWRRLGLSHAGPWG